MDYNSYIYYFKTKNIKNHNILNIKISIKNFNNFLIKTFKNFI